MLNGHSSSLPTQATADALCQGDYACGKAKNQTKSGDSRHTSASVNFNFETPTTIPGINKDLNQAELRATLPTAPITLHGASYRIVEFDNRRVVIRRVAPGHCVLAPRDVAAAVLRGVEVDALVPLARRSGLAAVAQVADARGCWL